MGTRRTAAVIGALLVAGAGLGGQSAAAAPPSTGFPHADPIKSFKWIPSEGDQAGGELKVRVVCPADGEDYFIRAWVGSMSNVGRFGTDPGEPVDCTGRAQTVSVGVRAQYYDSCRIQPGTFDVRVILQQLRDDVPYFDVVELATATGTVKVTRPSPNGIDCSGLE